MQVGVYEKGSYMNELNIDELLTQLMATGKLGKIISPVESISGGFLHRMYQVTTDCGTYAVKHLNTEIMSRPDAHQNYARAEKIEYILEREKIPIVSAIEIHGSKMQTIYGHYFYIFHWQEGHITDWSNISTYECNMAGNILGRIHRIDSKNVSHKEPNLSKIDWHKYVLAAQESKSEIASILDYNEELLIYAEEEVNKARKVLPDILCISNEDMDPKNIGKYHTGYIQNAISNTAVEYACFFETINDELIPLLVGLISFIYVALKQSLLIGSIMLALFIIAFIIRAYQTKNKGKYMDKFSKSKSSYYATLIDFIQNIFSVIKLDVKDFSNKNFAFYLETRGTIYSKSEILGIGIYDGENGYFIKAKHMFNLYYSLKNYDEKLKDMQEENK